MNENRKEREQKMNEKKIDMKIVQKIQEMSYRRNMSHWLLLLAQLCAAFVSSLQHPMPTR